MKSGAGDLQIRKTGKSEREQLLDRLILWYDEKNGDSFVEGEGIWAKDRHKRGS